MILASKYLLHAPRQKRVHEDIHPLRCGYDTFIQSDSSWHEGVEGSLFILAHVSV